MTFSMTLGLAVTFKNYQNFTCSKTHFLTPNSSTETNSGIHQNGCRSHCLITPLYLTIIILALSSVVTNLPNKTLIFHDLQGQKIIKFHDFPGLENEILKFHNFPGFP